MNKQQATPQNDEAALTTDDLATVSGGVTGGLATGPQPIQIQAPSGMAPPKYSAGWWDFVRSRGGQ